MKLLSLVLVMLVGAVFSCQSQQSSKTLMATAFNDKIKETPGAVLIDVRTKDEFSGGAIAQALNIDYNDASFEQTIGNFDKTKPYFVYCLSGGRSSAAAEYMRTHGFTNVYDLKGGIMAWKKAQLPVAHSGEVAADKISYEQYQKMVTGDSIVLVDFYAPWCAPCKQMEPMLNELSKEYAGKAKIIRLNIDENKALAKKLEVEEIPVFKMYRYGEDSWTHKGIATKAELIQQLGKK